MRRRGKGSNADVGELIVVDVQDRQMRQQRGGGECLSPCVANRVERKIEKADVLQKRRCGQCPRSSIAHAVVVQAQRGSRGAEQGTPPQRYGLPSRALQVGGQAHGMGGDAHLTGQAVEQALVGRAK